MWPKDDMVRGEMEPLHVKCESEIKVEPGFVTMEKVEDDVVFQEQQSTENTDCDIAVKQENKNNYYDDDAQVYRGASNFVHVKMPDNVGYIFETEIDQEEQMEREENFDTSLLSDANLGDRMVSPVKDSHEQILGKKESQTGADQRSSYELNAKDVKDTTEDERTLVTYRKWTYEKITMGTSVQYKCLICSRLSDTRKSVVLHMSNVHNRTVTCGICSHVFENETHFRNHSCCFGKPISLNVDSGLDGENVLQLEEKPTIITTTEKPTERTEKAATTAKEIEAVECRMCNNSFKSCNEMYHQVHTEVSCHNCPKRFDKEQELRGHPYAQKDPPRRYRRVTEFGDGKYLYDDKWEFHIEGNFFVCDSCGTKKKLKERMTAHIIAKHEDPIKYSCHICSKFYATPKNLSKHLAGHTRQ